MGASDSVRDQDTRLSSTRLPTERGGRLRRVTSGYRPNHDFGVAGQLNDAQHEYLDQEWVQPGEEVRELL